MMFKSRRFSGKKIVRPILLVDMGSLSISLPCETIPDLLRFRKSFSSLEINFKLTNVAF
jgi:hypothetical protein